MTKVVNIKHDKYDVRIDRTTLFGNPYKVGRDGTREEVLDKYLDYFSNRLLDRKFRKKILSLRGKTLGCWCKPLDCHGDIIVLYLNNL